MASTREPGQKLTPAQNAQFAAFAWKLSLKGKNATQIVDLIFRQFDELISEKTVDRMLSKQRKAWEDQAAPDRVAARADHMAAMSNWLDEIWRQYGKPGLKAHEKARLIQLGMQAVNDLGKARGVFTPETDEDNENDGLIREYVGVDIRLLTQKKEDLES